jgi:hypothetical protein
MWVTIGGNSPLARSGAATLAPSVMLVRAASIAAASTVLPVTRLSRQLGQMPMAWRARGPGRITLPEMVLPLEPESSSIASKVAAVFALTVETELPLISLADMEWRKMPRYPVSATVLSWICAGGELDVDPRARAAADVFWVTRQPVEERASQADDPVALVAVAAVSEPAPSIVLFRIRRPWH